MDDNKFAVAVLIHDDADRADTLLRSITALVTHTDFSFLGRPVPVYIYVNGTNANIDVVLDVITRAFCFECEFHIEIADKNYGCSHGVNAVNELVKDYEYVLFLEGDWVLYKDTRPTWLMECIHKLDERPDIAHIYLRKFISSLECRQFYGGDWFGTLDEPGSFHESPHIRMYTNNPVIRRNSSYYTLGIIPFPIVEDETKHNPDWGKAEIDNESKYALNSLIYEQGIFVHIDPRAYLCISEFGRGLSFQPLPTDTPLPCQKCRWGFIRNEEPKWCGACLGRPNAPYKEIENEYVELMR